MPKILISSDHHHDNYKAFSKLSHHGVSSRLEESLQAEDFLFALMRQEKIRLHVRCGDLFDKKNAVDSVVYSEIFSRIKRNCQAGIGEIILVGNHDSASGFTRTTLEPLAIANLALVVDEPFSATFYGTEFHLIPHIEEPAEYLAALQIKTDRTKPNLLFTHVGLNGAKTGSEFLLPQYIDSDDLHPERFEYVFIGHIHEPQQVRKNAWYVGSLMQRNFADEGSPRRCFILDLESGKLDSIEIPGPRFHTIEFNNADELSLFTPNRNDYYRVSLPTGMDIRRAKEVFDGAAGVSLRIIDAPTSQNTGTIPTQLSWDVICEQYIKSSKTLLDKPSLLAIGREILADH